MKTSQVIIWLIAAALIIRLWLYGEANSPAVKGLQTFVLAIIAYVFSSVCTIQRVK